MDDRFLNYSAGGPFGKKIRVAIKDISTVAIEESTWGQVYLKILGGGGELAKTRMPTQWAYKAQEWILEQIEKQ